MTDFLAPTGTGGTGALAAGGVVLDPLETFNKIHAAAIAEDIMVVNAAHLNGNPTFPDPTTGAPLSLDDLFVQAGIFITAVSTALTAELLNATRPGIATSGGTSVVPFSGPTITTVLS
jgi:hypothetical protein